MTHVDESFVRLMIQNGMREVPQPGTRDRQAYINGSMLGGVSTGGSTGGLEIFIVVDEEMGADDIPQLNVKQLGKRTDRTAYFVSVSWHKYECLRIRSVQSVFKTRPATIVWPAPSGPVQDWENG